jgi:hypothetical protein
VGPHYTLGVPGRLETTITLETAAPSDTTTSAVETAGRDLRLLAVAAAGFVLVALGAFLVVETGSPDQFVVDQTGRALQGRVEPGGAATTFTQPTDHPIRVPPISEGRPWEQASGTWGTLMNRAYVYRPVQADAVGADGSSAVSNDNLLLLRMGTNGSSEVILDQVAPGAGLAFRAASPADYLGFVVNDDGTGWELVRVVGGNPSVEPIDAEAPYDGTLVSARYVGDEIVLSIDGQPVHTTSAQGANGTKVGLVVRGAGASGPDGAMFDNFLANPAVAAGSP